MNNRRIKLGAPAGAAASLEVEEKTVVPPLRDPLIEQERRQGWTIVRKIDGIEREASAQTGLARDEPRIRPSIMLAAFGAGLLALLAIFSGPRDLIRGIRAAAPDLMREYAGYLDAHKDGLPPAEIERRKKTAEQVLLAAAAAEEIHDRRQMRRSLNDLLILDNDTASPLYRQSVAALRAIPEE